MKKTWVQVSLTVTSLIFLATGCGNKETSKDDLKGTEWEIPCSNSGTSRSKLVFSEQTLSISHESYSKSGCRELASVTTETYDFDVGDEIEGRISGQEGTRKLDLKIKSIVLRQERDQDIKYSNEQAYCGLQTWQKSNAVDVLAAAPDTVKIKINRSRTESRMVKKVVDGKEVESVEDVAVADPVEVDLSGCPAFGPGYAPRKVNEQGESQRTHAGDPAFSIIKAEFLDNEQGRLYLGALSNSTENGDSDSRRPSRFLDQPFKRTK